MESDRLKEEVAFPKRAQLTKKGEVSSLTCIIIEITLLTNGTLQYCCPLYFYTRKVLDTKRKAKKNRLRSCNLSRAVGPDLQKNPNSSSSPESEFIFKKKSLKKIRVDIC